MPAGGSPGRWAGGNASSYEIPSTSHGEMEKDKFTHCWGVHMYLEMGRLDG